MLTSVKSVDGANIPSEDFVKISCNLGSTGVMVEVPDGTEFVVTVKKD